MRLHIKGFVATDTLRTRRWTEIVESLVLTNQESKLKITEDGVTIVPTKFEDIPKTWMRLFEGRNTGKLLTQFV